MKRIPQIIVLILLISACHKNQPEMNNNISNPCDLAHEVSAEFEILEITGQTGSVFEKTTLTDTILHTKSVRFIAKDSMADYTWYIGNEVITERSFVRYFDNSLSGQNIPVTLVLKKDPNHFCLPNDDGYDSITKILHVSQFPILNDPILELGSIEGTYRVKSMHLVDSFDVNIDISYYNSQIIFNIENYDGMGSNCFDQAYLQGWSYRQIWTNSGTSTTQCDYLRGNVHNRINGGVEINFSFGSNNVNASYYYERNYLGRKLN